MNRTYYAKYQVLLLFRTFIKNKSLVLNLTICKYNNFVLLKYTVGARNHKVFFLTFIIR